MPIEAIILALLGSLFPLLILGMILSRLYYIASKECAFVRTGFGGDKIIMNGGALVFPVLHEVIRVNMNTLRLEVHREAEQALSTRDGVRFDVRAEFYIHVKPTLDAVGNAARTLGRRTADVVALKELLEGKFVDALRVVAADMTMEELHENRVVFIQQVQMVVSDSILTNGVELESLAINHLEESGRGPLGFNSVTTSNTGKSILDSAT